MIGNVKLIVPGTTPQGGPTTAVVQISGAVAGDRVTVRLGQSDGVTPFMAPLPDQKADASGAGDATVTFSVVLDVPGKVVLLAHASDSQGPHFTADAKLVVVT